MPPSGVDYASGFLNGYAPEYVRKCIINKSIQTLGYVRKYISP